MLGRTASAVLRGKGSSAVQPYDDSVNQNASVAANNSHAQIMLSYRVPETGSRGDGTVVRIQSYLESKGYTVFVGESSLQGGQRWTQVISKAITNCEAFVALCSTSYGSTKWTLQEFELADQLEKKIVPVWHSGIYPPTDIAISLTSIQRVPRGGKDLRNSNFEECMQELLTSLSQVGCKPRNPPPPPRAPPPPPRAPPPPASSSSAGHLQGVSVSSTVTYSTGSIGGMAVPALKQQVLASAASCNGPASLAQPASLAAAAHREGPYMALASPSVSSSSAPALGQPLVPQQPPGPAPHAPTPESNEQLLEQQGCDKVCMRRTMTCCVIFIIIFIIILVVSLITSAGGDGSSSSSEAPPPAWPSPPAPPPAPPFPEE